jgi:hypothetical protein
LCDAAREYQGLASILGGFISILKVKSLPAVAHVWFAGRVGFSEAELLQDHLIVVTVSHDSGPELARAQLQLIRPPQGITASPHPELAVGVNTIFPLPFPIQQEGLHWVEMTVDDINLVRLPLKILLDA